ncbi:MAG: stage III sporulation protein AF [Acetatifactor sp.]|nr:stage III sporulation protein AF [Acetatifactor sp.]
MRNFLFQAICRVGIFMVCAQALVHFRPKEAYEKYLKLLVSVMILIQLFLPIGSLLLGGGRQDAARQLEAFGRELEQELEKAQESAFQTDSLLEQMTLEEVRRRMEEQEQERVQSSQGQEPDFSGDTGMEELPREAPGEIRTDVEPVEPVKIGG